MDIEYTDIYRFEIPFVQPIKVPIGTMDRARNVVIRIVTDEGLEGWGEASPFEPITGDSQESSYATAQHFAKIIKGLSPIGFDDLILRLNQYTVGEPSIRSAFDMAIFDLVSQAAGVPLFQWLGGVERELSTDLTIGMLENPEESSLEAASIIDKGYEQIKVKVGRQDLADIDHIRAIRRAVGPRVKLIIDANQGWDCPAAIANLKALETFDIKYCEQPVAAWDFKSLSKVRALSPIPLCADESLFTEKDAFKLLSGDCVDYLNIKLGKSGGIRTALKINAVAESVGSKCMIGCFAESRLGLSASVHLALARPNIDFINLDSAVYFREDPIIGGMSYDADRPGKIVMPSKPGLGASVLPEYLSPNSTLRV